jgi:hypothetical protein
VIKGARMSNSEIRSRVKWAGMKRELMKGLQKKRKIYANVFL